MTLLDFMAVFAEFQHASWQGWRAVLARLTPSVREFYGIVGRGAGKSRIVALIACFFASREYRRVPGEFVYIGIFAPDRKQASVTFRYVTGLLRSVPALAALIVNEAKDSIELSNGIVIEVITAGVAAPRGRAYALAIVEEAAFLPTDQSANPDVELLRAVRPALARVPGSLLVVVSSPYARKGIIWQAWQKYHDKPATDVLLVQASTRELNPTFDSRAIAKAYEEDPASAAAEFGGQFRTDVESFISRDVIDAIVVSGRYELPFTPGCAYQPMGDFAGGGSAQSDSAVLGIAHPVTADGRTVAVLDLIQEFRPPFSPEQVCAEFAITLKRYGLRTLTTDRWAGQFPVEQMRKHQIEVTFSERSKSEIYRDVLPLINSGTCELLANDRLIAQLSGLERRTARGGRDSIDHAPGGHDDVINAAAGALVLTLTAASRRGWRSIDMWTGAMITGIDNAGREWRDRRPWNGIFPPEHDAKGRPLGHPARYVNGVFMGNVV